MIAINLYQQAKVKKGRKKELAKLNESLIYQSLLIDFKVIIR